MNNKKEKYIKNWKITDDLRQLKKETDIKNKGWDPKILKILEELGKLHPSKSREDFMNFWIEDTKNNIELNDKVIKTIEKDDSVKKTIRTIDGVKFSDIQLKKLIELYNDNSLDSWIEILKKL